MPYFYIDFYLLSKYIVNIYKKTKIYNLNYVEERDVVRAIEPKVKDLIQLTTFGADREFDRGNKIFEITSKAPW